MPIKLPTDSEIDSLVEDNLIGLIGPRGLVQEVIILMARLNSEVKSTCYDMSCPSRQLVNTGGVEFTMTAPPPTEEQVKQWNGIPNKTQWSLDEILAMRNDNRPVVNIGGMPPPRPEPTSTTVLIVDEKAQETPAFMQFMRRFIRGGK